MNETGIRPSRASDVARLEAIARRAYAKYVPGIGREPAPMSADYGVAIAAGHAIVIEQGGMIAGYLIGCRDNDTYFVENIAIDPAKQGQGLGRVLLQHAISDARQSRLSAVWLFTNTAMTESRAVYAHLGFVETHCAVEHGYNRVYMRLSI